MNKFLAATAALIATFTSASAADLSARPYAKAAPMMAMPAAYDWSGFYIGGQVGYAGSDANYTFTQPNRHESFSFDPSSIIGGGHAGLQGQWGSWVLGVEGAYNYVDLSQTDICCFAARRAAVYQHAGHYHRRRQGGFRGRTVALLRERRLCRCCDLDLDLESSQRRYFRS